MEMSDFNYEFRTQLMRFIDDEQIVDVPTLNESTRIPIPEHSHAQELLCTSIPLDNRIAHLIPYIEPTTEVYSLYAIARKIGAEESWVKKVSNRIGIVREVREDGGQDPYSSLDYEILHEEWSWYQAYEGLSDHLSSLAIGRFVARHDGWVEAMANELAIFPDKMRLGMGQMGYGYPKTLIPQLRHLILVVPSAEDRLTLDALSEETGRKKSWIQHRLEERGIMPDERRSVISGKLARHYQADSLEIIIEVIENEPQPAGDWLTVGTMAKLLGKDYEWVRNRVEEKYLESGELRRDDDNKSRLHYPPSVLEELRAEVDELGQYPYATQEDLAISALARIVGHDERWVKKRLPYTTIQPRTKINPANNRPLPYYNDDDVETLEALPYDILKHPLPSNDK